MKALRSLLICAGLLSSLVTGAIAEQAQKLSEPVDTEDTIPFAFAISGGISLGSYEAGLNWAFVSYLNHHRDLQGPHYLPPTITAAAGASAGSINALLTAISWCRDPSSSDVHFPDTISDNVFRDAWLDIDIKELLPENKKDYEETDSLLSRTPLKKVIKKIKEILDAPHYRDNCKVPLAFIVTRATPSIISVDGIKVDNDRFVIPILMEAKNRKLSFSPYLMNLQNPTLGNVIHLQGVGTGDGNIEIPTQKVLDALLASSAFPFAFGQVLLDYCTPAKSLSGLTLKSKVCPEGYYEANSYFVDGGVFDNVPLGTAKALSEGWQSDRNLEAQKRREKSRRTTYVYMEPGNLREGALSEAQRLKKASKATYGLLGEAQFLTGALRTGSTYELYKEVTGGDWNHQMKKMTLKVADALAVVPQTVRGASPITDPYLQFLQSDDSRSSTLVDGVLQSLNGWQAWYECEQSSFAGPCNEYGRLPAGSLQNLRVNHLSLLNELAKKVDRVDVSSAIGSAENDVLGDRRVLLSSRYSGLTGNYLGHFGAFIDEDFRKFDYYAGTYDAVNNLAKLECSTQLRATSTCFADSVQAIYKLLNLDTDPDANAVFATLGQKELGWPLPRGGGEKPNNVKIIAETFMSPEWEKCPGFIEFIKALKEKEYKSESEMLKDLFDTKSEKETEFLFPVVKKLISRMEKLESAEKKINPKAAPLHTVSILGGLFAKTLLGDDGSFRLNQGFADSDLMNALPYEVSGDLRNGGFNISWEPRLPCAPTWSINPKITPIGLDQFGRERVYYSELDLYVVRHTQNFFLSSYGTGPLANLTWEDVTGYSRVNFGMSGFVSIIGDKLRLTAGTRSFDDTFFGDNFFLTLGLTDFQGIVQSIYRTIAN
ncbi:MAG: hypothetical protein A2075_20960 [Geobacteraceae bacterium GWC2_58_44]|nr:MAG: hypothetical protein A2075_20960 [Geobacteraceae bacterium GWC2_58_44]HBG05472.1 hypothetical protein [Geobacter sp.]